MVKNNHKIKQGMILAWGEIFLKSAGVQKLLKKKLVNNLFHFLKKQRIDFKIYSGHERIFIETKDFKKTSSILKKTFGLVWFAQTHFLENASLSEVTDFVNKNYQDWIKKEESFALRVKKGPIIKKGTEEIIKEIAENIERKVNLDKPKREIFIEGRKQGWFLYFNKQKGPGGLPAGSQGKALSLISGGIDSPVAAYLMAKRGAKNTWIHFHSFPLVSEKSIEKVKETAEIFLNYQPKLKVYFIPFSEIQKKIKTSIPAKYRVLFYRRIMLEITQKVAQKEDYQALITGESLGQVSSQTLPNLKITQEGIEMPTLRPLIGMDKEEIIYLAKQIKTFEISIQPQEDCCTLFVPKGQTADAKIEIIKKLDKNLKLGRLVLKAIKEAEITLIK